MGAQTRSREPADLAGGQNFPSAVGGGRTIFHLELTYHGDTLVQAVLEGETLPCG